MYNEYIDPKTVEKEARRGRMEHRMTVIKQAFAKINLFLDITGKREDGYHDILSYMQAVTLCDTLTVSYEAAEEKTISVTCDNDAVPCDRNNLVYQAAMCHPIVGRISVHIEKKIPLSAGLAGGSADAAATLLALNELCESPLAREELQTLGAALGADVPFCMIGGAAVVTGIGDRLVELNSMINYPIVIAKKGEGMSTPAAYRALDRRFDDFRDYKEQSERFVELLSTQHHSLSAYQTLLFNIFEEVVEPLRPAVTELKGIMLRENASVAIMSGSGTSVFGIFHGKEDAEKAVSALKKAGAEAYLCYAL